MPAHTILVLACIGAAFAFFAAILVFGDLTWSRPARPERRAGERRLRKEIGSAF